jgi:hypothetical protein
MSTEPEVRRCPADTRILTGEYRYCEVCRERDRRRRPARSALEAQERARRRERGVCVTCEGPMGSKDLAHCLPCRKRRSEVNAARRARKARRKVK